MKHKKCNRCGKIFPINKLIQWIDELDNLSPFFCRRCYSWLLDNWQEGDDIESMGDDEC